MLESTIRRKYFHAVRVSAFFDFRKNRWGWWKQTCVFGRWYVWKLAQRVDGVGRRVLSVERRLVLAVRVLQGHLTIDVPISLVHITKQCQCYALV